MNPNSTLVITSIAKPNWILENFARGCNENDVEFIVIGDESSPEEFSIEGCRYYSLGAQLETGFSYVELSPTRHYARKNIGYLLAIRDGCSIIVESDDDNIPADGFWGDHSREQTVPVSTGDGWVNIYRYFSDENIWPRGFPLDHIKDPPRSADELAVTTIDCPIQQGLVDDNPDIDAILRMVGTLPQTFRKERSIGLSRGSWCPFNSQNTLWWSDAFPLLYLPGTCSMRMTDIWRSFVAQRIAWENDWGILFRAPDMRQERNEHDLMRDFADEVLGYLNNSAMCASLETLNLRPGKEYLSENMITCYEQLIADGTVDRGELPLLMAWINDLRQVIDGSEGQTNIVVTDGPGGI